jgi:hypothetical protein
VKTGEDLNSLTIDNTIDKEKGQPKMATLPSLLNLEL